MAPRRMLLATERYRPGGSGLSEHLVAALTAEGRRLTVIASGSRQDTADGTPVIRVGAKAGGLIRATLHTERPDVVLAISPSSVGLKVLKRARQERIPTVVLEDTNVPAYAPDWWLDSVAARADRLLVTSTWIRDRLAEQEVPAELWYPGVDTELFSPARRDPDLHARWAGPADAVVVGYVGGLNKRHGVRRLTEAATATGTNLVVIGSGPQLPWLRARLPKVSFTGKLSAEALATAMASLDVVVHPGSRETGCAVLREASASGVPVIAPRAGGTPDVIAPLESGVLYDPAEPGDLIRALDSVVVDRRRGLLGDEGRRRMLARDWPTAVADLVGHLAVPGATGLTRDRT